jgi:hypothetical protein
MTHIDKEKIKVNITLTDEKTLWGYLFVAQGERVSDLLNNGDMFLTVHMLQDRSGRQYEDQYKIVFLNKNQIYRVDD